ncbi:MAG: hypothetical protein AAF543_14675 [Pseudomonadota bacterium]
MFTSQPPIDDRCTGLSERPSPFIAQTTLSSNAFSRSPITAVGLSELDRAALEEQLAIACAYAVIIDRIAARHALMPSMVAGFCSRRSGWGLDLSPTGADGTRDLEARPCNLSSRQTPLPPDGLGYVRGLMGLDFDRHPLAREPQWRDPESNLDAAFSMIAGYRSRLRRVTTLQGTGLLRASFTAFECGLERVEHAIRQGQDVDSPTPGWCQVAGRGCGQDVVARAAFFQAEGWD